MTATPAPPRAPHARRQKQFKNLDAGERAFRADIAGLRAVAVLLVVIGHAGVPYLGGGFVGVDVFFVISGFLITSHLAGELRQSGRISLVGFYARRMVRLLPAAGLVIVATVAAAWHWCSPMFAKSASNDGLASALYVINIRLAIDGTNYHQATEPPSPFQHFWSLAVEEQYYLVWPVVLLGGSLAWRRARVPSMASAALVLCTVAFTSFAACQWLTDRSQPWAFFSLPTRAWELAAGGLVALGASRLRELQGYCAGAATWLGVALIVVAGLAFDESTPFPGSAALLPVTGAVLVIAGGCAGPRSGAVRLLGLRPLQAIGAVSYSWYLWHWPALVIAPYALDRVPSVPENLLLAFLMLIPAWLSLVLVEDRVRFHRRFRMSINNGLALGLSLTVGAALFSYSASHRSVVIPTQGYADETAAVNPIDVGAWRELIRAGAQRTTIPSNLVPPLAYAASNRATDKGCIADLEVTTLLAGCEDFGHASGKRLIVTLGDSHARQWFPAVDWVAKTRGWRFAQFVKGGCPASAALTLMAPGDPFEECMEWREEAFDRINQLKPDIVLLAEKDFGPPPRNYSGSAFEAWTQAWRRTIDALAPSGARVVYLADTPWPPHGVITDCLARHPRDVAACNFPAAKGVDPTRREAALSVMHHANIPVVDPIRWFCADGTCPAIIGNTLVYRDLSHVSNAFMALLGPVLNARLPPLS